MVMPLIIISKMYRILTQTRCRHISYHSVRKGMVSFWFVKYTICIVVYCAVMKSFYKLYNVVLVLLVFHTKWYFYSCAVLSNLSRVGINLCSHICNLNAVYSMYSLLRFIYCCLYCFFPSCIWRLTWWIIHLKKYHWSSRRQDLGFEQPFFRWK